MKRVAALLVAGVGLALLAALPAFAQDIAVEHKSISDALIAQGPIGIVCLILLSAAALIYRDARADRLAYDKKIDDVRAQHDKAMESNHAHLIAISMEQAKAQAAQTSLLEKIFRGLEERGRK